MRELRIVLTEEEYAEWIRFVRYLMAEDNPATAMRRIALGVADEHRKDIERFMRRARMRVVQGKAI